MFEVVYYVVGIEFVGFDYDFDLLVMIVWELIFVGMFWEDVIVFDGEDFVDMERYDGSYV